MPRRLDHLRPELRYRDNMAKERAHLEAEYRAEGRGKLDITDSAETFRSRLHGELVRAAIQWLKYWNPLPAQFMIKLCGESTWEIDVSEIIAWFESVGMQIAYDPNTRIIKIKKNKDEFDWGRSLSQILAEAKQRPF